jgi:hypothetical protein
MVEIGKISKPEVKQYENKKKIYFIKNIYLPHNATDTYKSIFNRYWKEVEEHLAKLEVAGKVAKIFCESIYMTGEKSMQVLHAMNASLEQIIKKKIDEGAEFLPLEDKDVFGAYIDWNNCLMIVQTSAVYDTVHKLFRETLKNRLQHITKVLQESIAEGEAVLLILRDEDRKSLELPDDIEIFPIVPPAFDDLEQYIRDAHSGKEYWRT